MKKLHMAMTLAMLSLLVVVLSACRQEPEARVFEGVDPELLAGGHQAELGWTGLDQNFAGQLTLSFWGLGPGQFRADVGRTYYDPMEMTRHGSAVMAAGRIFNAHFPYITLNVQNWGATSTAERTSFYHEHGFHVDAWMSNALVTEIIGGHVADLTLFDDDPVLDLANPIIMRMITHLDRLWAVPVLAIPFGTFVNRTLAENQNLDTPPEDWTMDEFINFVSNSRRDEFYGINSVPWSFMNTMTQDFHYQLLFRQPNEPFVRVNTPAMRAVHQMVPRIINHTLEFNRDAGHVAQSFMDQFSSSPWLMFAQGGLLAFYGQPWTMSYATLETSDSRVQVLDWDYFPRPSTDWVGNHVTTTMDIMPIRNFAMDDGDPSLSMEEYNNLRMAWEFLRFYTFDLRSWQARSDMIWGTDMNQSAKTESLPYTIGQLYYDMIDIHFQAPERQVLADARQFPGYHYILQLWEEGAIWGLWHNNFPFSMNWEGGSRSIIFEWNNRMNVTGVGVNASEPSWYDQFVAHLPFWEPTFNERWAERYGEIEEALHRFYAPQRRPSQN